MRKFICLSGAALASLASAGVALAGSPANLAASVANGELSREYFTEDPIAPRYSPRGYDVTIVMYTDYQCPVCRASHGTLKKLVASDRKVRIIYRDWPVFGAASDKAARLAIASMWQKKHRVFHDQLMQVQGPLDDAKIRAAAKRAGVDWARLESDLKKHDDKISALMSRNDHQAALLGLEGTPGFIIGRSLVPGGLDLKEMRELVAKARKGGAS
ncbi:DsbA family protein [Sphingomicrobium lutaoense]|uniref:Protein-disulfide isomerase n=1 Tax=Sphingomicrobium lutaoense TaxID=515949 RepID=A0A839Z0N3_9SPHN|nr:DsbA family protein [Sphingomicrobium lutaoense]MBB3764909.1 protein-disulfide isomerase [Sphingomicrobium lutaoense]